MEQPVGPVFPGTAIPVRRRQFAGLTASRGRRPAAHAELLRVAPLAEQVVAGVVEGAGVHLAATRPAGEAELVHGAGPGGKSEGG